MGIHWSTLKYIMEVNRIWKKLHKAKQTAKSEKIILKEIEGENENFHPLQSRKRKETKKRKKRKRKKHGNHLTH